MSESSLPLFWSPGVGAASDRQSGRVLEPVAFLDRIAAERAADPWLDLMRRSGEENPFLDPDFLLPALRHFDPGGRIRVAMVAGPGKTISALAPMFATRLGHLAPAERFWAHEFGPLGTPLLDPVESGYAAASLLAAAGRRALVFPYLPIKGKAAEALRHAAKEGEREVEWMSREARAMVDRLAPGPADPRKSLPVRRRKELARQMRRLGEMGTVTIETVCDAPDVRNAFEEFLRLEAGGWKGRERTELAGDPHRLAFARDAVFRLSGKGGCHIAAIRLNGRPLAMLVSFVGNATIATWKIAYDEEFARFSPGAQLMLEATARFLAEPSVQRIDSLAAPDHPMIDHLWRDRLAIGTLVVAPPRRGPIFRAGLALAGAESRFRASGRAARRLLRQRRTPEKAA